ncbi:sigma-B regulation protein RsbU (phosphoserine phosphatase) [Alkalispirochaeta americana]|uniref:Sigma-B regulation protein RsbU (Phosphoserine phosphatase) n=1 Tax=Alkalispirochaeta americana TaxID=159291 RepID=A0A1N6UWH1_9SPIO|nr:sigma-B regulation protein RsbU (phosphoserine phosphatase) [Alkalispirochaeta americana]
MSGEDMAGQAILYVDDEPEVLRAFRRDLRPWLKRRNIRLDTVESGQACLELLEESSSQYSLVISDLRMPSMKGSDLLLTIGQRYPGLGLVLLTAYSDMEEISRAVTASILGLLQKPWTPPLLEAELERFLEYVQTRRNNEQYFNHIQQQLRTASEFQQAYLRLDPPRDNRFSLERASYPRPGMLVQGDYYDAISLDRDRHLLLLGDVAGHGIKPAFITGIVKLLTREEVRRMEGESFSPARFLSRLNDSLIRQLPDQSDVFVSLIAFMVDLRTGEAIQANAGHPRRLLSGGTPTFRILPAVRPLVLRVPGDTPRVPSPCRSRTGLFCSLMASSTTKPWKRAGTRRTG